MGWFIGQSRAKLAFVVQLFLNLTNMALSAFFVLWLGMTSDGVGLAALIAEWSAVTLALVLAAGILRGMGAHVSWPRILDPARFKRTLLMNGDVMIRTLCLVFAFTFFTARGARAGDVIVAANAVLLNLFEVSAYLIDGFAYASEALVGQSVGRGTASASGPRSGLPASGPWCWGSSARWSSGSSDPPHRPDDAEPHGAGNGAGLSPLGGGLAGARRHLLPVRRHLHGCHGDEGHAQHDDRVARRVPAGWWLLEAPFGNHGLWAALNIFFIARGIRFATRMPSLERRAFGS